MNHLARELWRLPLAALALCTACDPKPATPDTSAAKASPSAAADGDAKGASASRDAKPAPAATLPKACDLIDVEVIRKEAGLPPEAPIIVGDMLDAGSASDDAVSCTWKFGEKKISLQVTREPAGNKFDTWASRMVKAKRDQGYAEVAGLANGAAFRAEESHLVFRHGETWLYSLSYAGDRPGDTMQFAPLQALAASVPKP